MKSHDPDVTIELLCLPIYMVENSLASQPLFLRGGARGGGGEKESGDLSQHFVTQWNAINCNK